MRHVIQLHKYKIAFGLPVALLIATSLGFAGTGETLELIPENKYIAVGSTSTISVVLTTEEPINVVGGTVLIPSETNILDISIENSIVDIWTNEPAIENNVGFIEFGGGIVESSGFVGKGIIFEFSVVAEEQGVADLDIEDAMVLAHDGDGTDILDDIKSLKLVIRDKDEPSPDVNADNKISILDFTILTRRMFGSYDPLFDFNNDKKITFSDLLKLVSTIRAGR